MMAASSQAPRPAPPPAWDAADILRGADTAVIRLGDHAYTLRLTRAGKLILTK